MQNQNARDLKLKQIKDILSGSIQLKSKRELIEKFIEKHSLNLMEDEIEDEFERYMDEEKIKELNKICSQNNLNKDKLEKLISEMLFYGNVPNVRDKMIDCYLNTPSLLERDKVISDLTNVLDEFLAMFYELEVA